MIDKDFKIKKAIDLLLRGEGIATELMNDVMLDIMNGRAHDAAIGAFLMGLTIKGESVAEVVAAAKVMRQLSKKVTITNASPIVDIVGTGGDGASLMNISTASAIIAAAAGVAIAKHGNIAASSSSGSADFLREAGVVLQLEPEQIALSIERSNFGFMYAPAFHQAMRHAIPARKATAIRTIFNLLGPLANPAKVTHQVIGVFAKEWLQPIAKVCAELGSKRVIVVHSQNGLDEFSVCYPNDVIELKFDDDDVPQFCKYQIDGREFGLQIGDENDLKVRNSKESLQLVRQIFETGQPTVGFDMLALNAAAVLYVGGLCHNWQSGVDLAKRVMQDGRALTQLQKIAQVTQSLSN